MKSIGVLAAVVVVGLVCLAWLVRPTSIHEQSVYPSHSGAEKHSSAALAEPTTQAPPPAASRKLAQVPVAAAVKEEQAPAALAPDFLFRCPLPSNLGLSDLQASSLDLRNRGIPHLEEAGSLFEPAEAARLMGATIALSIKSTHNTIEIRSRDRTWSSGVLHLRTLRRTGEVLPLELRPVARVALRFEDTHGEPVDITSHASGFKLTPYVEQLPLLRQSGSQLNLLYVAVAERDPKPSSLHIERIRHGSVSFEVSRAGYEIHDGDLNVELGRLLQHTVVLRPLPTAGGFSGRVTTQSGNNPPPDRMTGTVRVVDSNDRRMQFNVPLQWKDGVAEWSTGALPFGEYRVWVGGVGSLFVTPTETRILTPPGTRVDWVWRDGKPLRSIGVDARDATTGAAIEGLHCTTRISSDRSYSGKIHNTLLMRSGLPEDSPWVWEISAEGTKAVKLRMADFSERRTITPDQVDYLTGPTEVWFARIELQR